MKKPKKLGRPKVVNKKKAKRFSACLSVEKKAKLDAINKSPSKAIAKLLDD